MKLSSILYICYVNPYVVSLLVSSLYKKGNYRLSELVSRYVKKSDVRRDTNEGNGILYLLLKPSYLIGKVKIDPMSGGNRVYIMNGKDITLGWEG